MKIRTKQRVGSHKYLGQKKIYKNSFFNLHEGLHSCFLELKV